MSIERKACLGGVTFAFSGWLPQAQESDTLPKFYVADGTPEIEVCVERVSELTYPKGRIADYESPYLRQFKNGELTHRFYRRDWVETGRDYAHVTYRSDQPFRLQLQFCEARLKCSLQQLLSCLSIEELMLQKQRAVLHASWIELDGKAILFSGRSGIGKSTQAALWERYRGAKIRNGDRTLLRSIDGAEYACGIPYAGTSGICENVTAPICAIVMLEQAKENRLRRLPQLEAVKRLLSQMPMPKWRPDMIERGLEISSRAARSVPVYELCCLPEESAVALLEQALG